MQVRSGFKFECLIIQSNMGLLGLPIIPSGSLPNALTNGAEIDPPPGKTEPLTGSVGSSLVNKKRHPGLLLRYVNALAYFT